LAVKINGNLRTQQEIFVQQQFQKKLCHFNRNSQFKSVM